MREVERREFEFKVTPELVGRRSDRSPVVIVGAGPVGLACALDLASRGVPVVVLERGNTLSDGSRAICWAKRTLEIFDRLGVGRQIVEAGVDWQVGRVFRGNTELFAFDLLSEAGHEMPAFINLQQHVVEALLLERLSAFAPRADIRWCSEVSSICQERDGVAVTVATPRGDYTLKADWVIAADGSRSPVREMLGLELAGQRFQERFLIADVRMQAAFPKERLFWFEPTFHHGDSVLLHRQPDDIFRIDFQLGRNADAAEEQRPDRVLQRVRQIVGQDVPIDLVWCSIYSFSCARLERFVHDRVIFAGDSAHIVSPFGARGGNGGIQDADNLCWKLAAVVKGEALDRLIASYDEERGVAADENIRHSARTQNFMSPNTTTERRFRDAAFSLAKEHPFARSFVNGGRLSRPCSLQGLTLLSADEDDFEGGIEPGGACEDAPVVHGSGHQGWLLDVVGDRFVALHFVELSPESSKSGREAEAILSKAAIDLVVVSDGDSRSASRPRRLADPTGLLKDRYGARPGTTYLIRPDAHVAARFASLRAEKIVAAADIARALTMPGVK